MCIFVILVFLQLFWDFCSWFWRYFLFHVQLYCTVYGIYSFILYFLFNITQSPSLIVFVPNSTAALSLSQLCKLFRLLKSSSTAFSSLLTQNSASFIFSISNFAVFLWELTIYFFQSFVHFLYASWHLSCSFPCSCVLPLHSAVYHTFLSAAHFHLL